MQWISQERREREIIDERDELIRELQQVEARHMLELKVAKEEKLVALERLRAELTGTAEQREALIEQDNMKIEILMNALAKCTEVVALDNEKDPFVARQL